MMTHLMKAKCLPIPASHVPDQIGTQEEPSHPIGRTMPGHRGCHSPFTGDHWNDC